MRERRRLIWSASLAVLVAAATFASLPMAKSQHSSWGHLPFTKTWHCTGTVTINGKTVLGDCYSVYTVH